MKNPIKVMILTNFKSKWNECLIFKVNVYKNNKYEFGKLKKQKTLIEFTFFHSNY